MKKNSPVRIILLLLLVYAVLLSVLIAVERGYGNGSGITDAGSALWYLAATLTTVGYGDVAPVTPAGRVIGAVLMLSSAGLFLYFLGLLLSVFFGQLVPKTRLRAARRRPWYVFAACSDGCAQFACNLAAEEPAALFVFLDMKWARSESALKLPARHVTADMTLGEILSLHRGKAPVHVFFLGGDDWHGYAQALDLAGDSHFPDVQIVCETDHTPDHVPGRMVLFDRYDAAARSYWMQYPVKKGEHLFLIAGDGRMAERLLERGLLMNVLSEEYALTWRAAGDWGHFRNLHPELREAVGDDQVILTDEAWNASSELFARADRIILCADDETVNLARMSELFRYYAVAGTVYVYGRASGERAYSFGDPGSVLTGENVMHSALNRVARRMNDFYRRSRDRSGSLTGADWEDLSEFQRQSNIAAADHLLTKARLLLGEDVHALTPDVCGRAYAAFCALSPEDREKWRRLEHERWMRFHRMYNWRYASERQNALRLHDCLVPYEELTREAQLLDDAAYELFGEFGTGDEEEGDL